LFEPAAEEGLLALFVRLGRYGIQHRLVELHAMKKTLQQLQDAPAGSGEHSEKVLAHSLRILSPAQLQNRRQHQFHFGVAKIGDLPFVVIELGVKESSNAAFRISHRTERSKSSPSLRERSTATVSTRKRQTTWHSTG